MFKVYFSESEDFNREFTFDLLQKYQNPVLIVPEQVHSDTERSIYFSLGAKKISEIEITSFSKFSSNILKKYTNQKPYAQSAAEYICLLDAAKNTMFSSEKSALYIRSFRAGGYSPLEVNDILKNFDSNNKNAKKISSISQIFSKYDNNITKLYSDHLDDVRKAAEILPYHPEYLQGRDVFLLFFDGFTGAQIRLLKAIGTAANSVTAVFFAGDAIEKNLPKKQLEPYYITELTIKTLESFLGKCQIKNLLVKKNPTIFTLLKNIKITDPYEEAFFVAAKIRELITKKGYSQNEIAVIPLDNKSDFCLREAFYEYNLKFFSDIREPLIEKPIVRFILSFLETSIIISQGKGDVFSFLNFLKNPFLRVDYKTEIFSLRRKDKIISKIEIKNSKRKKTKRVPLCVSMEIEKAILEFGLKIWQIKAPFKGRLYKYNDYRKNIIKLLLDFSRKTKNKTAAEITVILARFIIQKFEIYKTVVSIVNHRDDKYIKGFKIDSKLNDEYRLIWSNVVGIFEVIHSMYSSDVLESSNETISLTEYLKNLNNIFSSQKIARPPEYLDSVVFADLNRSRLSSIKALFITGASKKRFPPKDAFNLDSGFSEREITALQSIFPDISDNKETAWLRGKYIAKRAILTATKEVYITCPEYDFSKKPQKPADLSSLNLNLTIENCCDVSFFTTKKSKLQALALLSKFNDLPEKKAAENTKNKIKKTSAKAIYNIVDNKFTLSASRSEVLCGCFFKYFIQYGLGISKTEAVNDDLPNSLIIGLAIHKVLYEFLLKFNTISPDDYYEFAFSVLEKYIKQNLPYATKRTRCILQNQILAVSKRFFDVVKSISDDYSPSFLEKDFSFDIKDSYITLKGKFDRADLLDNNIRIFDYKTGSNIPIFNPLQAEKGINAQVLFYSLLAESIGYKVSGAYYFSISKNKAVLLEKIKYDNKKIFTGFSVISENENTFSKDFKTSILDISPETYYDVLKKLSDTIKNRTDLLLDGCIDAFPTLVPGKTCENEALPCQYCDYLKFCGYNKIK